MGSLIGFVTGEAIGSTLGNWWASLLSSVGVPDLICAIVDLGVRYGFAVGGAVLVTFWMWRKTKDFWRGTEPSNLTKTM